MWRRVLKRPLLRSVVLATVVLLAGVTWWTVTWAVRQTSDRGATVENQPAAIAQANNSGADQSPNGAVAPVTFFSIMDSSDSCLSTI